MPSQNEWNGHAATRSYLVQVKPWPKTTGFVAKEMAKKGFRDSAEIHISQKVLLKEKTQKVV